MTHAALDRAEALIAQIPDYPEPGVLFRDISPMIADGEAMRAVCQNIIDRFDGQFDIVGGIEARGFLLAGYIAAQTGVGMLPVIGCQCMVGMHDQLGSGPLVMPQQLHDGVVASCPPLLGTNPSFESSARGQLQRAVRHKHGGCICVGRLCCHQRYTVGEKPDAIDAFGWLNAAKLEKFGHRYAGRAVNQVRRRCQLFNTACTHDGNFVCQ